MNEQVFDLMKDRFNQIDKRLNSFESKIDNLTQWRWKVYGMSVVVGGLSSVIVTIIAAWISRG